MSSMSIESDASSVDVAESTISTSLPSDIYTIESASGVGPLETSSYDYQTMIGLYPHSIPYSSIMNISRDMALDLYQRATRVVRFVRDDSLAANVIKYKNFVIKRLKKRPVRQEFNCEDVIIAVISIVGFIYNVVVDAMVTTMYWREGSTTYAMTSITCLIGPLIIVNFINMLWYKDEDHECSVEPIILQNTNRWSGPIAWVLCCGMHTLLLGQIYRTIIMIYVGIKSWGVDRARERLQSEVSSTIAAYHRQMEQSEDGSSTSSTTSDSVPQLSHAPSLDDPRILPNCERSHPCVDYYSMFVHQECDIAILDLLDGFLHDGTQVILQIYIIMQPNDEHDEGHELKLREIAQIQSATMALLTLSWCFSEYSRAMRSSRPDKRKLNLLGMILMFLWRLFTLIPRVFAFALFASLTRFNLITFVAIHWLLMSAWVRRQRSADGSVLKWGEVFTCLVVGYVFVFCFMRTKSNEPTRAKYIAFYTLIFLENTFLLMFWFCNTKETYGLTMVTSLTGMFFVGLMFMAVYYKWVHPEDHLPDRTRRARLV